jgi:predicted nucleotidyltransferase
MSFLLKAGMTYRSYAGLDCLLLLIIMSIYSIFGARLMVQPHLIATVNQKILFFLAKFSDMEFYERQIARKLGIAYGSANRALNELYATGALKRRQQGKMYFYSINKSNPTVADLKRLINIVLIEPLVEELKGISSKIVLYGSCAQGVDTSQSDLDLFVASNKRKQAISVIENFTFPQGFESINIQPVVKNHAEILRAGQAEQTFLDEVEQGIVLWERASGERKV